MSGAAGGGGVIGPHQGSPVRREEAASGVARGAMILLHGRGASAGDILGLRRELFRPDLLYVAPQAAGGSWYPQRFLAPLASNEPFLGSALQRVEELVRELGEQGTPAERIVIVGFSQGACLALEHAARHPRRYGGVAALTGGLIGPEPRVAGGAGSLAGTPVLMAAGDPDPHVPWSRVAESARLLAGAGGRVTLLRFPGMGHTINEEELEAVRGLVERAIA